MTPRSPGKPAEPLAGNPSVGSSAETNLLPNGETRHSPLTCGINLTTVFAPRRPVLIAHPDRRLCEDLAFHLRVAGLAPIAATSSEEAVSLFAERAPDVVVTGLDLEVDETWTLIERAAAAATAVPVVVVAAQTPSPDDCLRLGRLGCRRIFTLRDDLRPLVQEIADALPAEALPVSAQTSDEECCGLSVDTRRMVVSVGEQPVDLTPLEYKLLLVLMEERGSPLHRTEIFRRVWGGELPPRSRSIDVLVKRLRRRLEPQGGCCSYIQTAYRVGYRFSPRPRAHA